MTVTVDQTVEQFTAIPRQLFINGQWTEAASGKTFETPNPATFYPPHNISSHKWPDAALGARAAWRR